MKINGIDITEQFGAQVKQWRFAPDTRDIKNDSEWEKHSPLPIFQAPYTTFKDFTCTLMVYGNGRDEIYRKMSDIMAACQDVVDIEMDGWTHKFKGVLDKTSPKEVSETSRNRWQELALEFTGYEHGDEVSVSASGTTIEIDNPGNMVSPAIIELTPTIGQSEFTITGLCRDNQSGADLPVTISATTTGKTIVLDGVDGLVTEDGALKAGDVDMWELPSLVPGHNTVTLSTQYMNTLLRVEPIYY